MKKILFIDNTAHHVYGQLHLMRAFAGLGYDVHVLVQDDGCYYNKIVDFGFKCHDIKISGKSINPFRELKLICQINKYVLAVNPHLICSFTIKPNLYGAIIARKLDIPIITCITGLGYVFMRSMLLRKMASMLYKFAFYKVNGVFFQNDEDRQIISALNVIPDTSIIYTVPGSGVDIGKFNYVGVNDEKNITFLFSGRLLWDKGINELIEAFKTVRNKYPSTKLIFIGNYYPGNPSAISKDEIDTWQKDGLINYLGMVDNVSEVIAGVDCVVLPSYREGMPRCLLEASSMGKPIITVDSVGCKNVVEDGVTGYMAKVKDVASLADAMVTFVELPFAEKQRMGLAGRKKMEQEFDQQIVINKYIEVATQVIL